MNWYTNPTIERMVKLLTPRPVNFVYPLSDEEFRRQYRRANGLEWVPWEYRWMEATGMESPEAWA